MNQYKKSKKSQESIKKAIPALVVLVCVLAIGIIFFYRMDQMEEKKLLALQSTEEKDYVKIGGIKCKPKPNLETYLFLGTDIPGKMEDYQGYNIYEGIGQSDTIELLIIDKTKNTYATLTINRNTITDMYMYNDTERSDEEFYGQICLAYAFGIDGKENSCINTADAVSRLLYNQKIDAYLSLGLDAIPVINHQLGGVTVTIHDDFSNTCPSLVKGETRKLTDEEAEHFCHDRMNLKDDTAENRISRQQEYLEAAKPVLMSRCKESEKYILDFYDALGDYMYTNITKKQISKIAKAVLKNKDLGQFAFEGEVTFDEETGFDEFYVDEDNLAEVVRELFYDPVE